VLGSYSLQDFLANEIQTAFEKLTNQARFIQMIVDKQLVVANRKKADIVVDLRKHNFRPFKKVTAAKSAGETEDAAEDEEKEDEAGEANDYDYLLGMAIYSLTKEKIEKLRAQAEEKERELLALLEKSPKQMWNTDLDRFLESWEVRTTRHAWRFTGLMGVHAMSRRIAGNLSKAHSSTRTARRSNVNRPYFRHVNPSAGASAVGLMTTMTTSNRSKRLLPSAKLHPSRRNRNLRQRLLRRRKRRMTMTMIC
jgi:hypothetical protein